MANRTVRDGRKIVDIFTPVIDLSRESGGRHGFLTSRRSAPTLTATKTDMKKSLLILATAVLAVSTSLQAEVKTAQPSPYSELDQVVGVTNFTVQYSRPGVKDRTIYGDLVPYGEIWRTGANATTKLKFDTEVTFGDKAVPAGEYVLFTIPGEDEWTVVLYGDTGIANAGLYDESKDVARVTVKPIALDQSVETFTIGFDALRDDSATLYLDWADVRVPVPIKLDTKGLSAAGIESAMTDQDSWTARDYANAAEFYSENDVDLDQAATWMEKAVAMNPDAFWWQHGYAQILAKQGKTKAAKAAAEKSIATAEASEGGDFGYVQRNEDLLAKLK